MANNFVRLRRTIRRPVRLGKTTVSNSIRGTVVDLGNPQVVADYRRYQHLLEIVEPVTNAPHLTNYGAGVGTNSLTSGTQLYVGVHLPRDFTVAKITLTSGATAGATLTHQFADIYSSDGTTLTRRGASTDLTSTAWAANSEQTFTHATPYVTPSAGLYYVGILVTATTTPNLASSAVPTSEYTDLGAAKLVATGGTGLSATEATKAISALSAAVANIPLIRIEQS